MSRHIQPELIAYFDDKLKDNAVAQQAIADKLPRVLLVEAAKTLVGIREKTGNNDGKMVELLQKTIGDAENESYCMSGQQSLIAYVELKLGIKSPVYASEGCLDVWENTPHEQRVKYSPLPGAICIWQHGSSYKGHTGIILACDETTMHLVECNTGGGVDPQGDVVRNGDGCYYTVRSRSGTGDMHVKGWIKPF